MNNKFLLVAVASTVALGGAIASAPAHALTTPTSNIGVTVTVPEVLYLRTVKTLSVPITPTDLNSGIGQTTAVQVDSTSNIDLTSPFVVPGTNTVTVTKKIPQVFAVWSNSPATGNALTINFGIGNANLSGPAGGTGKISSLKAKFNGAPDTAFTSSALTTTIPGLVTPAFGDVQLGINLDGNQTADTYSGGTITINAQTP